MVARSRPRVSARRPEIPIKVSHSPRNHVASLKIEFYALLLAIAASFLSHPARRAALHLVSKAAFTTWTYADVAARMDAHAASLHAAGVRAGARVLMPSPPINRGEAVAFTLALEACGAAVVHTHPSSIGLSAWAEALSAEARPDFIIGTSWERFWHGLLAILSMCRLLRRPTPRGYTWIRQPALLARTKTTARALAAAKRRTVPPIAVVAAEAPLSFLVCAAAPTETLVPDAPRAVARPVSAAAVRAQTRVYGSINAARHAGAAAIAAPAADGPAGCECPSWVAMHGEWQFAQHDLALGGMALLHPMSVLDPSTSLCPRALHHLIQRFAVTVLSLPPDTWRTFCAQLPTGSLRGVRSPWTIGPEQSPHVFAGASQLVRSKLLDAEDASLSAMYTSSRGDPIAVCDAATGSAPGVAWRYTLGGGFCVGTPPAGVSVRVDAAVWGRDGRPPSPKSSSVPRSGSPVGDGASDSTWDQCDSLLGETMSSSESGTDTPTGSELGGVDGPMGEIVISYDGARGQGGKGAAKEARREGSAGGEGEGRAGEARTGEVGSIDACGRLWVHGALDEMVRHTCGTIAPRSVEGVLMATGQLSWCALVPAQLSASASMTVVVVQLAAYHPLNGSKLTWGPEMRVILRDALRRSRWAEFSGMLRFLLYEGRCPYETRLSSRIDRLTLCEWAGRRLREHGIEERRLEDRMDSLQLLHRKKHV